MPNAHLYSFIALYIVVLCYHVYGLLCIFVSLTTTIYVIDYYHLYLYWRETEIERKRSLRERGKRGERRAILVREILLICIYDL